MKFLMAIVIISQSFLASANSITQIVDYGNDGTPVTAVPDEGYHFTEWSDHRTDNPRTDLNVNENISVTAYFEINRYNILFLTDGTEGSSISGETSQIINYNQNSSPVTVISPEGYHFKNWTLSNIEFSTSETISLINIKQDYTLVANFEINTYTLNYFSGENGHLEGETEQRVQFNNDATTITAISNKGYLFDRWSDNIFSNIRQDKNIKNDIFVMAYFKYDGTKVKNWNKYY